MSRKLKAIWSFESAQDLDMVHSCVQYEFNPEPIRFRNTLITTSPGACIYNMACLRHEDGVLRSCDIQDPTNRIAVFILRYGPAIIATDGDVYWLSSGSEIDRLTMGDRLRINKLASDYVESGMPMDMRNILADRMASEMLIEIDAATLAAIKAAI